MVADVRKLHDRLTSSAGRRSVVLVVGMMCRDVCRGLMGKRVEVSLDNFLCCCFLSIFHECDLFAVGRRCDQQAEIAADLHFRFFAQKRVVLGDVVPASLLANCLRIPAELQSQFLFCRLIPHGPSRRERPFS